MSTAATSRVAPGEYVGLKGRHKVETVQHGEKWHLLVDEELVSGEFATKKGALAILDYVLPVLDLGGLEAARLATAHHRQPAMRPPEGPDSPEPAPVAREQAPAPQAAPQRQVAAPQAGPPPVPAVLRASIPLMERMGYEVSTEDGDLTIQGDVLMATIVSTPDGWQAMVLTEGPDGSPLVMETTHVPELLQALATAATPQPAA